MYDLLDFLRSVVSDAPASSNNDKPIAVQVVTTRLVSACATSFACLQIDAVIQNSRKM